MKRSPHAKVQAFSQQFFFSPKSSLSMVLHSPLQLDIQTLLYFAKWYFVKGNEMKSVLCEMENYTLRNENLYFAKWKTVLSKMKLLLSNFMKNVFEEASANLLFYYNHDRDTPFLSIFSCGGIGG